MAFIGLFYLGVLLLWLSKGKVWWKYYLAQVFAYLKLIIAIPQHSQFQARGKCLLSSEMYVMSDWLNSIEQGPHSHCSIHNHYSLHRKRRGTINIMLTSHPSFSTIGESIKVSCQLLHRLSHQSLDYKDSRLFAVTEVFWKAWVSGLSDSLFQAFN